MRPILLCFALLLTLPGQALAQPWLECAQLYLPAVRGEADRQAFRTSLAYSYARNGEFSRAQALIDEQPELWRDEVGAMAAQGALQGGHVAQALVWGAAHLPNSGPARERFLRSARSPEAAHQALELLRARGGVSASSLVFTVRELGGMPRSVSDFYLREVVKVADQVSPPEWLSLEETLEASGAEFQPLSERVLETLLEHRPALLAALGGDGSSDPPQNTQLDHAMRKYAAFLLARRGRFQEAEQLWREAGSANLDEQRLYWQNQYLGGRQAEALAALSELEGLEEDARVWLAQFLMRLGRYEEIKPLGTEPLDYLELRQARRDLERGQEVERWLGLLAQQETEFAGKDSVLYPLTHDLSVPATVREQAQALLDKSSLTRARARAQAGLSQAISQIVEASPEQRTLLLLLLDDDIRKAGVSPDESGLQAIDQLRLAAPPSAEP